LIAIKAGAQASPMLAAWECAMLKHAVIVANPNANSLSLTIAGAYADEARVLGDVVVFRDLYREGFDPRLAAEEIPRPEGFRPGMDVEAERRLIGDANVFAFVYPLWFNAPPAILVGYVQRVFGMGFGYGPVKEGGNQPLLRERRLISFSTSGAPTEWLRQEGGMTALRNLFDQHLADVCGMTVIDHVHFGGVTGRVRADVIERYISETRRIADNVCGIARV
jgi:NAD(P)H dehydrogenase (quinone)